jgi:hypothetical protein
MCGGGAALLICSGVAATLLNGCRSLPSEAHSPGAGSVLAAGALLPSPRLIVGYVIAVDPSRRFAFVEPAADAPAAALAEGTRLLVRTPDLRDTGQLLVSAHRRGRTLGAKIAEGQPSPGDEVVWLAP